VTGMELLVFVRCIGFASRAPGFSHPSLPAAVRVGLALVVTIAVLPAIHRLRSPDGLAFVAAAAIDFAVGAAIGFAASVLYDGAYAGGRALDDYVGVRGSAPGAALFAASAFGRVWSMVFTAGFFLLGGYRVVIAALARSFEVLPPGTVPSTKAFFAYALALPAAVIEAALLVAGPAIALVFVAQVTLGALSRVIPRFAAFTLSFPVVFGMAIIATVTAIPLLFERAGMPWLHIPFLMVR
jgi:flagellar biosynthesis protein FliR